MGVKAAVTNLANQIEMLVVQSCCHVPDVVVRERLRRYGQALFDLLWYSASFHDQAQSLMTLPLDPEELQILEESPRPSLIVVMWMQETVTNLSSAPDYFRSQITAIKAAFDTALHSSEVQVCVFALGSGGPFYLL